MVAQQYFISNNREVQIQVYNQNYINRAVQIQIHSNKFSIFGKITNVDNLGFIVLVEFCPESFYKPGEEYFISHSTPMSIRFIEEEK